MENRIREIRDRKGLTLDQVAQEAGTIASTIEKLEKGRRRLDIGWMRRVAKALGVKPADLLLEKDHPYRLRNENEAAVLDIFRRLSAENQTRALSRLSMALRAQEGTLTEAEWLPEDIAGNPVPDIPRGPKNPGNRRKATASSENAE